jgi:MoaA/NifB/PqqE/SkfB family radical SAM enzyme
VVPWQIVKRKLLWEARKRLAAAEFYLTRDRLTRLFESSFNNLSIETTNICNANCIFCAYQYQKRPTGVMSFPLFQKLIDEFVELGGGNLGLTPTVGDPLVDKLITKRIAYARSKPALANIGMYSNMISLDRIGLKELLGCGVSAIIVSTSGFDKDMYRRVYRSEMYDQMLDNVLRFGRANNEAGRPVDFQVDMRADRPAAEVYSFPDFKKVAEVLGIEKIGVKFRYDSWAGFITPEQLSGDMLLRTPLKRKPAPCAELYSGPMVYWNGNVGACGCRDVNASELIIGDANKDHIGAIWFGEEIRRLRKEFTTDKIKPICDSCTHYNSVSVRLMNRARMAKLKPSNYVSVGSAGAAEPGKGD